MNIAKILSLIACLGFLSTSFASELIPEVREVHSESELKPHFGVMAGVGDPDGSQNVGGNYAVELAYQPVIPFSLGLHFAISNFQNSSDSDKLVRNSLLIKGGYNFGGNLPVIRYSYLAVNAGMIWEDTRSNDGLAFGAMPNAGFDIPVLAMEDGKLSLGVNVAYLLVTSGNPDTFSANGVVKYWY